MHTHDPYAALKNVAYRWLFVGHVVIILATQIQATALGWLLYDRTHSAAVLGLSGLAIFLPVLILALPIGFYVDSRFRRHILVAGIFILILSAIMMSVDATNGTSVPLLFIAIFINGIGNAMQSVARPVIMREVIASHHAENSASWSIIGRRVASVIGPIIAGGLISWSSGASIAFEVSVALYVIGLLCMVQIALGPNAEPSKKMTLHSLTEGIRYINNNPLILSATLLDMFAVLLGGATGLLPLYAQDILHVGATGLGILRAAPSIGSAVMAFALAHRPPLRRAGLSLLAAVACYGLLTIVFGISTSPLLSFVVLLLIGAADAISVTVRSTILQLFVPDRFRGRVYGVNMIFVYSSNELGDFETGMVAALIGAQASVVTGGIGAIAVALFFGWKWKELRNLKKMKIDNDDPLVLSVQ